MKIHRRFLNAISDIYLTQTATTTDGKNKHMNFDCITFKSKFI